MLKSMLWCWAWMVWEIQKSLRYCKITVDLTIIKEVGKFD